MLHFTASEHLAEAETTGYTHACIAGGAVDQRTVHRADGRSIDRVAGQAPVSAVVRLTCRQGRSHLLTANRLSLAPFFPFSR